jgi:hypothetical protein
MDRPAMIALLLGLLAQVAEPEPVGVVGSGWAPFISPMGEPFRSRGAGDDPLTRWFGQADGNGDGRLSRAELEADGLRFFATLDEDGNREILPDELVAYEWQTAPEIQVNSRWRDPRGEGRSVKGRDPRTSYDPRGLQGAARYSFLNIPQPVAAADTDFNRAVTVDEFRAATALRFGLLDKSRDQQLDLAELRAQLPPTRKDQRRAKADDPDARIGTPVKLED